MASSTRSRGHVASSSPLPSVDEIFSRIIKPPTQNDHVFKSTTEFLERQSVGAASFIRPERVSVDLLTPRKPSPEAIEPDSDDSVCVIKIPVPGTRKARRKKGSGKLRELKPKSKKPTTEERSQEKKPWMKYRASESPNGKSKSNATKESGKSAERVRSHHFPTPVQTKQTDDDAEPRLLPQKESPPDEPLDLALASRRRANWTPPPAQQLGPEGSRSSDIEELLSSAARNCNAAAARVSFESLLENYVRKENASDGKRSETPEGIPDALKKRKLAQPVPNSDSATVSRDTSPAKKAPKRKKPRTITELATAAYAAPEEPEAAPAASLLAYVEQQTSGVTAAAKGKPRKKTTKSKRLQKAPEPASILLSPGTAIKKVANQDFVFGTSSQLAREHSPTFLRDIQAAVRASNSILDEPDPFTTPLNSDSIEPPPRKKLWEVGARDDDGRLVDLEIIDLVGTPAASVPEHGDSFGYLHEKNAIQTSMAEVDEEVVLPKLSPASAVSANMDSADALREIVPCMISSDTGDLGTAKISDVQQQICTPPNSMHPSKALELLDVPAPEPVCAPVAMGVEPALAGPARPRYELYTDVQLTKEVKKFGFKPIKPRTAMIALLGQCWESQNLPRVALSPLPSNQPLSTMSGLTSSAVVSRATAPETLKRPRGRPRKDSTPEVIPNEPPPSAQPPAPSPKRPRGRPRKDAGSPAAASTTKSKPKVKPKASGQGTKKAAKAEDALAAATPTSRPKVPRPRAVAAEVIEIPDSASDGSLLASSPEMRSSSPPAVDVCLSLDEDAEMSLAPSVTSTQSNLMDHITKAVKAAPPTQDPNEPSWHEKMLMYDPVILEDLAAWLNSGQLSEAGILLLSPTNQVLLLHRVKTSSSFASAHVFPGGNLDSFHDGDIPAEYAKERHVDGPAYRIGAIRECFEETGILLARRSGAKGDAALVSLPNRDREAARKQIHGNHVRFSDWAESVGGTPDVEGLIPFTRWVTPTNVLKRFTTQMYLYLLPDTAAFDRVEAAQQQDIIVPTPDGGVEHTAARFDDAATWLAKADAGEIILFPPQYYLLHHVARFCTQQGSGTSFSVFESQRQKLLQFLRKTPTASSKKGIAHPTSSIPWSEKVMSPQNLLVRSSDKRIVLGLDKPGLELKDSGRGGDWERVVLVKFSKEGPRKVEIRDREEILAEEREEKSEEGSGARHKL
ncbi:hypothetical protein VdG1_02664 [Verticillium dahliae VDG1]|nr:hypothetical protein VdG1_02664 [Verticillium dahliae VDG1]